MIILETNVNGVLAYPLVAHLKHCAVALVKPEKEYDTASDQRTHNGAGAKIDKSVLTISEPKRMRSKEHLRFVAQQPVSFAGDRRPTPITSASPNPRGLASR